MLRLIIDTDAGHDDLMAIAYLLTQPTVVIEAITIANGLAEVESGARNILKLLTRVRKNEIPVFVGDPKPLAGTHAFPRSWRRLANELPRVNLPEVPLCPGQIPAVDFLKHHLSQPSAKFHLLTLGPLTNVARAIIEQPSIVQNIEQITMMGGVFKVPGNVFDFEEFKSPSDRVEWNFFVDPLATKTVLESGLKLFIIPLDATNQVRLDLPFLETFKQRQYSPLGQVVGEILEGIRHFIEDKFYYAWDPLAAMTLVDETVVRTRNVFVQVNLTPPHTGQTRITSSGQFRTKVALNANRQKFIDNFINAFSK